MSVLLLAYGNLVCRIYNPYRLVISLSQAVEIITLPNITDNGRIKASVVLLRHTHQKHHVESVGRQGTPSGSSELELDSNLLSGTTVITVAAALRQCCPCYSVPSDVKLREFQGVNL